MEPAAIPGPVGRWLFGNLADIDAERPMQSLCDLTREYGPIWKFRMGGKERIVIGSQALMNEVCDERRFAKIITASLQEARNGVFDGLGTAYGPQEENWGIAHRVLAPRFGMGAIRNMFDETQDIVTQLVAKWDRHGPNHAIEVTDDFTRLTLDVIALCAMGHRFNSFYTKGMNPFVRAMSGFLKTSGDRARRFKPMQLLCVAENQAYWRDIDILRTMSMAIINERKEQPADKEDLLHSMLHGTDPDTGKRMTDDNIVDNMITFLIAGHETTSGLLSFTFYYLLTNPKTYALAQQEVDYTVGPGPITPHHLKKLPYINAVLRESLRLTPTVPSIALAAKERTVLGGKYAVDAGTPIIALFPMVHRDPAVYGSDADKFRPERMLDEEFHYREKQYPH
ncbi:cytochrome P450, partial [Plenodomus tracheiphilus IPT5]